MRNKKGKWIAGAIFFRLAVFAILSVAVMLLWNNVVVMLFGLKAVSYFQSLGLLLLVRIFTGNIGPRGFGGPGGMMHRKGFMSERWKNMSEEDRKQRMQGMGKAFDSTEIEVKK